MSLHLDDVDMPSAVMFEAEEPSGEGLFQSL